MKRQPEAIIVLIIISRFRRLISCHINNIFYKLQEKTGSLHLKLSVQMLFA